MRKMHRIKSASPCGAAHASPPPNTHIHTRTQFYTPSDAPEFCERSAHTNTHTHETSAQEINLNNSNLAADAPSRRRDQRQRRRHRATITWGLFFFSPLTSEVCGVWCSGYGIANALARCQPDR